MAIILTKTLKSHFWLMFVMAALVASLGVLVATSYDAFGPEGLPDFWEQMPNSLSAFLRVEGTLLAASGPQGYMAVSFRHPLFLIVIAAFAIATASSALAREIERRTILLLLARPLQRYQLVLGKGLASLVGLVVLVAALLVGTLAGVFVKGLGDSVDVGPFLLIGVNALSLALAILGYAYLFSAMSNDGSRAVLISTGVTVAFFFVDFISSLFDALEPLGLLSIFYYYDPVSVAVEGSFPALHVGVLLAIATVTFGASAWHFQRRDIVA